MKGEVKIAKIWGDPKELEDKIKELGIEPNQIIAILPAFYKEEKREGYVPGLELRSIYVVYDPPANDLVDIILRLLPLGLMFFLPRVYK